MLSLSTALSAALGAPVQQPCVLVRLGFATPQYWTSGATLTWGGQTWTQQAMALDGLNVQALTIAGTLSIGNGDDVAGGLVLAQGVADMPIDIYGYDAAATGSTDVVLLCNAVGSGATIAGELVQIGLRSPSEFLLSPRTFVRPQSGFTTLLPANSVIKINGQTLILERR